MIRAVKRFFQAASFVLLAALGTSVLMYCAPGYLTEAREMDASHAASARTEIEVRRKEEGTLKTLLWSQGLRWIHGDLGRSRQFDLPVKELLPARTEQSARLLLTGVTLGWSVSFFLAASMALVDSQRLHAVAAGTASMLLALPVGAIATICLLHNLAVPGLVLAVIVGVRDFKLQHRIFQTCLEMPCLLQARAQGLQDLSILRTYLWPTVRHEVLALIMSSFTLALSALVPVEVIFDLPGLGQLAWSAAMNRDLPVLLTVTTMMAACVALVRSLVAPTSFSEKTQCA